MIFGRRRFVFAFYLLLAMDRASGESVLEEGGNGSEEIKKSVNVGEALGISDRLFQRVRDFGSVFGRGGGEGSEEGGKGEEESKKSGEKSLSKTIGTLRRDIEMLKSLQRETRADIVTLNQKCLALEEQVRLRGPIHSLRSLGKDIAENPRVSFFVGMGISLVLMRLRYLRAGSDQHLKKYGNLTSLEPPKQEGIRLPGFGGGEDKAKIRKTPPATLQHQTPSYHRQTSARQAFSKD